MDLHRHICGNPNPKNPPPAFWWVELNHSELKYVGYIILIRWKFIFMTHAQPY